MAMCPGPSRWMSYGNEIALGVLGHGTVDGSELERGERAAYQLGSELAVPAALAHPVSERLVIRPPDAGQYGHGDHGGEHPPPRRTGNQDHRAGRQEPVC